MGGSQLGKKEGRNFFVGTRGSKPLVPPSLGLPATRTRTAARHAGGPAPGEVWGKGASPGWRVGSCSWLRPPTRYPTDTLAPGVRARPKAKESFASQDTAELPPSAPPGNGRSEVKLICLQTLTGGWMPTAQLRGITIYVSWNYSSLHCIDALKKK